jgi:3-oxoacyl-[acyl-carrier-protein] synthase-1
MARVAVTAVGMLTSVGYDAVGAAAALRAGITRPAPLRLVHFDAEELGRTPVVGHPIAGITDGYEGTALLALMAGHVLRDLVTSTGLAATDARARTGLFLGISPYRSDELPFVTELMVRDLPGRTLAALGSPLQVDDARVVAEAHAAVAIALDEAVRAIQGGQLSRAIVIGVDSLVRDTDLEWLEARGLLKTSDDPTGLVPGEGAGAVLLESESEARRRGARVQAWLEAVAVATDAENRAASARGSGRGLAEVIHRCLGARRSVGAAYHDLNGEEPRAWEWGAALSRLAGTHALSASLRTVADCLGDTGAASAAIAIGAAVRSFARGHSPDGACLICSSADSGKVAAALLTRGGAEAGARAPSR